jgi:hypothetical protein
MVRQSTKFYGIWQQTSCFLGEWVQTLSRKDKKTKQVKQEEDNNTKAKKRAQKDAKRITAELIAKAKKDSENAQQLAKQV